MLPRSVVRVLGDAVIVFVPLCVVWCTLVVLMRFPAPPTQPYHDQWELLHNSKFELGKTYWTNFYPPVLKDTYVIEREGLLTSRKNLFITQDATFGGDAIGLFQFIDMQGMENRVQVL